MIGACAALLIYGLAWDPQLSLRSVTVMTAGALIGMYLYQRNVRLAWSMLLLGALAWCTIALTPVARYAVQGLVRDDSIPAHVDAVIVLSGSVTTDGGLSVEALDRALAGLELVRKGASSTIVFTEVHAPDRPGVTGAADQRRLVALLPRGVRVITVRRIGTTRMEAERTAIVIPPHSVTAIAVVTSPLHTKRACATFEHVGYRVSCVAAFSRDISVRTLSTASERLAAFRMAVYERAALVSYRRHGWI